jgi:hypothetical protein
MIEVNFSSLKETRAHEFAMRFLFGGVCTVLAGLMAKRFGPAVGGLFLAFPAIFPAGASLIESDEKRRKAELGFDGTTRGRLAVSIDAMGASIGCIALLVFAWILWLGLPTHNAYGVILAATALWSLVSALLWVSARKARIFHRARSMR